MDGDAREITILPWRYFPTDNNSYAKGGVYVAEVEQRGFGFGKGFGLAVGRLYCSWFWFCCFSVTAKQIKGTWRDPGTLSICPGCLLSRRLNWWEGNKRGLLTIKNNGVPISGVEKSSSRCNTFPETTYYGVENQTAPFGMETEPEIGGAYYGIQAIWLWQGLVVAVGRLSSF